MHRCRYREQAAVSIGFTSLPLRRAVQAVAVIAMALAADVAAAESAWVRAPHSALRLIEAGPADGATLNAGLDLRLDAGWKTYWRYPGEAGLPPQFDFSGSVNVAAVEVGWPAPRRFEAGGTVSIGYHDRVVFPLHVRPLDPARPVVLAAEVSFAVCGVQCVPAAAALHLPLAAQGAPAKAAAMAGAGDGADAATQVQRFRARVPQPVAVGAPGAENRPGTPGPLAITAVAVDRTVTPWRATVEAAAPPDAELFVEGPTAAWALPVPGPAAAVGPGRVRFQFDLDGAPPDAALAGARLTLTLVSEAGAIEAAVTLE
jgi:DsbC/DsbD-like thiol-disulfide interchange protein